MNGRVWMAGGKLGFAGACAAWRFLITAWRRAWAAMLVASIMIAAPSALGLWSPSSPWRLMALVAALAAAAMAEGALYRVAFDKGRLGPAGLQFAAAEWRLGAVWSLTGLFMFVLGLLVFVVVLSTAFAVATSGRGFVMAYPSTWAGAVDGRGRAVLGVVGALCVTGLIWAGTRIAFGAAASVDTGKVQLLATWPATRRLVLPILLGRLLVGVAPFGFACGAFWLTTCCVHPPPALVWAASLAIGLALAGLWLPLSVGLMAYLYRRPPAT